MERKFCHKCGAENFADYVFCKNCGTKLVTDEAEQSVETPVTEQPATEQPATEQPVAEQPVTQTEQPPVQPFVPTAAPTPEFIEDVPTAEISDFVGKNSHNYMPKFFNFNRGSKLSWNWPVFLFGFLLKIPFVWFFYRKMYKVGTAVLAICLALSICAAVLLSSIIGMFAPLVIEVAETMYTDMQDGFYLEDDYFDYDDYYSDVDSYVNEQLQAEILQQVSNIMMSPRYTALSTLLSFVNIAQFAFVIIISMFANNIYYKKTLKTLKKLNTNSMPSGETVHNLGGTNTAAAVLTGIFGSLALVIIAIIPFIYTFVEIVMSLYPIV